MTDASGTKPRETLNVRIRASDRALIDRAAALTHRSRTDFVIDAARRAAEDALLERTRFVVPPDAYEAFLRRLDAAPEPNDRLTATLRAPAPWDEA